MIALLLALLACSDAAPAAPLPAPTQPSPPPETPRIPPPPAPPRGSCSLGEPTRLEGLPGRGPVRVARQGGLVVIGATALTTQRVDPDGHPIGEPSHVALEPMTLLMDVAPLDAGFVAIAYGVCDHSACLRATDLDATGSAHPPSLILELETPPEGREDPDAVLGPLADLSIAAGPSVVGIASVTHGGPITVTRIERGSTALTMARRTIERRDSAAPAEPIAFLGFSAAHRDFALVLRRGPPEDGHSEVWLATARGTFLAPSLHDAATIESIAIDDAGPALIASFEFSRPAFLRFADDGAERERLELPPGSAMPGSLATYVHASTGPESTGTIEVRDPAGDRVGQSIDAGAGAIRADVERLPGLEPRFLVAYVDATSTYTRVMTCELSANP